MNITSKIKLTGIYKIQSKIKPERVYIGSAVDIYKRWMGHLSALRHNKHGNSRMQNHFNKYGESDLQLSVLVECMKCKLIEEEQKFIDLENPFFNICLKAGSPLGVKHTPESRKNMSLAHKGYIMPQSQKEVLDSKTYLLCA